MGELRTTADHHPAALPIEDIATAFEKALKAGTGPVIDDFLQGEGPRRWRLLLELVHSELELRLRAKQPARLSDYLGRYPELIHLRNELAAVLETEVRLRLQANESPALREYESRYPDLGSRVREVFRRVGSAPPEVPGYEILEELGRGGMGVVYRARHILLKREVAVKVIRRDRTADPRADERQRARFRLEAEAIARVNHPHVVQIFETGENDGDLFIAMELIDGPSLQAHLDRAGVLDPRGAAALIEKVARAVSAVHATGIIHRDLKPDNVLLTAAGEPKVVDFGLARSTDVVDGRTMAGVFVGTPQYTSPEQAALSGEDPTEAMDVYGLGAVLYAGLTGRAPFPRADLVSTLEKVRTQPVVPIRSLRPEVPRDLETVCLKCLRKDSTGRYPSAEALADDLRRWLAGEPVRARPVGTAERIWKWCRRNKLAATLLTGLALVILLGTTSTGVAAYLAIRRANEAEAARDDAREQTRTAETEKGRAVAATRAALEAKTQVEIERDRVRVGLYQSLVIASDRAFDRRDVATAAECLDECPVEPRKFEWFVRRANAEGALAVLNHRGFASGATFANTGAEFVTCGGPGQPLVRIWDASSGRLRDAIPAPTDLLGDATAVAVSPNGKWVAVHTAVGGLRNRDEVAFDANTGTIRVFDRVTKKVARMFDGSCFAFSPDGNKLAFVSEKTISVIDLADGTTVQATGKLKHSAFSVGWHPNGKVVTVTGRVRSPTKPLFPPRPPEVGESSSLDSWDLDTGKLTSHSPVFSYSASTAAALEPGGKWVAVAEDEQIALRRIDQPVPKFDGGPAMRIIPARFGTTALAIRPDGKQLAAGGWDGLLRVFDLTDGSLRLVLHGHRSAIRSVAYSPDGTRLLTAGGPDETVRLWDPSRQLGGPELLPGTGAVAFHPTERTAAFPDANGNIQIWDLTTRRTSSTLPARQEWAEFPKGKDPPVVFDLAYRANGQLLAAYSDGHVRTWNPATRTVEFERELAIVVPKFFPGQQWQPTGCRFSRDGQWAAAWTTRSGSLGLNVFSMVDGRRVVADGLPSFGPPDGVAFGASGRAVRVTLKLGGNREREDAWDLKTELKIPPASVRPGSEDISPDGSRVAAVSPGTGHILIRDATRNRLLVTFVGARPYRRAFFSPDGMVLAATAEGSVELYDATARPVFWSGE